ncbi:DUF2752 domain-containing protein [Pedobacter rhodius]|uniref:DUF2752 domain-containing protein n=1 Tax=Pedobacter rhodius TaxID=3004098 RepID=UPI003D170B6C
MYFFFPECPFHKFLDLDCPGCGSQRAIHAILNGQIMAALDYNLLLVMSIPLLLIHLFFRIYAHLSKKDVILNFWYNPVVPKIILIIVIVFWIIRNIPAYPFTYLAA